MRACIQKAVVFVITQSDIFSPKIFVDYRELIRNSRFWPYEWIFDCISINYAHVFPHFRYFFVPVTVLCWYLLCQIYLLSPFEIICSNSHCLIVLIILKRTDIFIFATSLSLRFDWTFDRFSLHVYLMWRNRKRTNTEMFDGMCLLSWRIYWSFLFYLSVFHQSPPLHSAQLICTSLFWATYFL